MSEQISKRACIDDVTQAIVRDRRERGIALVPFLTGGYPTKDRFCELLAEIAPYAAAIEVGVPFSAPMADGLTIQHSSTVALSQGTTLSWLLEQIAKLESETPVLLMSYLNPLLAFGFDALSARMQTCGVAGLIVPDLPLEEAGELEAALEERELGLVQLVSPVTPEDRLRKVAARSRGFVYAVTRTGPTGRGEAGGDSPAEYLQRVGAASSLPVCAGFGVRSREHVHQLEPYADGAIVGSALIECIDRGESAAGFLQSLRSGEAQ